MWASINATAGRGGSRAPTAATSTAPRYPDRTDPSIKPPTSQHPPPPSRALSDVGLPRSPLPPSHRPLRPSVGADPPPPLPPRPHLPLPHRSAVYCANLPPSAAPWGDPAATRVGTARTDGRSIPGGVGADPPISCAHPNSEFGANPTGLSGVPTPGGAPRPPHPHGLGAAPPPRISSAPH